MSQYFPKPFGNFGGNINLKVDLSNYATKSDIKNISHVDISYLALKSNLASLKTGIAKLDIDKLVPVIIDLSKLSNLVKNDVAEKAVYDKVVAKVNKIDTSGFVLKIKYDADKLKLENKIPDNRRLVKKTDSDSKISELENKIPSISGLATTSALTPIENEIPNVSTLVKKTDYNTNTRELEKKITDHNHDKYITTPGFNKLTAENFFARLKQTNIVTKIDFDNKLKNLILKINSSKTKHVLVENELKN